MRKTILLIALLFSTSLLAQQVLPVDESANEPVEETFRSIYNMNSQSTETLWNGFLFFAITHRFTSPVSSGIKEFWGMDGYSNIRLGLAYGINDNLMVGIGRSRLNKIYDGYVKYKVLSQKSQGMPITLSLLGQTSIRSQDFPANQQDLLEFTDRLSYSVQALIARKFNRWLSLQLSPTYTHQNLSILRDQPNGRFSLGFTAHTKVNSKSSIQVEYYLNQLTDDPNAQDVVGISLDYTSVKHSFQIQFTNATTILPAEFLAYTNRSFFEADGIYFGFCITRRFDI